ncbi:succinylglutamate-semialdehyde dehydrogenase [Candidatus Marinamargulisbacteria bacterium SCGC AG-410-N11]|nr:succinylglutamate-semialdehyde dehydrogenase [Candidatus Marinamargulisbacteria bacterium SCGC AG-410-N11]
MKFHGHYIHNQWIKGSGTIFKSLNPATTRAVWKGFEANAQDVIFAVKSAREVSLNWRSLSFSDRQKYILEFQSILEKNRDELAEIISKETGKPTWEANQEVSASINKIKISIAAYKDRTNIKKIKKGDTVSVTRHMAHGVIAVIGPFNFPLHLPNGHIIPALLAGNTIIFKPSEFTPLVAEFYIKLWNKVNLPNGVLNMIQGGRMTGEFLVTHPDINGCFFTGSSNTGIWLSRLFGKSPEKILALEMGGNNPLIVSKVRNIKAAVSIIIKSAFITAGQRCTCARRLIMIESKKNRQLLKLLKDSIPQIVVGPYFSKQQPFLGPLINKSIQETLLATQDMLQGLGGNILVKMKNPHPKGFFLSPGLIDISLISDRLDDEWFGPLLQVIWVDNLEQAILVANDTEFGLAASILSDTKSDYDRCLQELHAGLINWNLPTTGAASDAPFGGIGRSGNHRPSAKYAADYCAYPVASMETKKVGVQELPGVSF